MGNQIFGTRLVNDSELAHGGDGLHAVGGRGGGKGGVFESGDPGGVAIEANGDLVVHGHIRSFDEGQFQAVCPPPRLPSWGYDAPSGMIGAFALAVLFALVIMILRFKAK